MEEKKYSEDRKGAWWGTRKSVRKYELQCVQKTISRQMINTSETNFCIEVLESRNPFSDNSSIVRKSIFLDKQLTIRKCHFHTTKVLTGNPLSNIIHLGIRECTSERRNRMYKFTFFMFLSILYMFNLIIHKLLNKHI